MFSNNHDSIPLLSKNVKLQEEASSKVLLQTAEKFLQHAKGIKILFDLKEPFKNKIEKISAYIKKEPLGLSSLCQQIQSLNGQDLLEITSIDSIARTLEEIYQIFSAINKSIKSNVRILGQNFDSSGFSFLRSEIELFMKAYGSLRPKLISVSVIFNESKSEEIMVAIPVGKVPTSDELVARLRSLASTFNKDIHEILDLRNPVSIFDMLGKKISDLYPPLSPILRAMQSKQKNILDYMQQITLLLNHISRKEVVLDSKTVHELNILFSGVATDAGNCEGLIENIEVKSLSHGTVKNDFMSALKKMSALCRDVEKFLPGSVAKK